MRTASAIIVCSLLLAACNGNKTASAPNPGLRDTAHTTAEYLSDHALMARTIEACSADNDAEYNERMTHAGCKAVRDAVRASRHQAE